MIVRELIAVLGIELDDRDVKKVDNAVSKFEGRVQKVGQLVGGSIFLAGFARAASAVVGLASDAEETMNVIGASFGANAADVEAWSTRVAKEVGRSEFMMREMAGTLGALLTPTMEGNTEASAEMATTLAKLAVDLGSFFNTSEDAALEKLRAGLVGSTEPLLAFGVNLQVASLQQFALTEGITKSVKAMTNAEKTALRYRLILRDTAQAQGDAANTADGYANASRAAADGMKDLATRIGQQLLPVAARFMVWARDAARAVVEVTQRSHILQSTMMVLAAGLAVAGVLMIAPFLPFLITAAKVALVIAAISVVVDELITFFSGGKTFIGEFIDELLGIGAAQLLLDSITAGWMIYGDVLDASVTRLGEWSDAFVNDMGVAGGAMSDFADGFTSDMGVAGEAFQAFWDDVGFIFPSFTTDMAAARKAFKMFWDDISFIFPSFVKDMGAAGQAFDDFGGDIAKNIDAAGKSLRAFAGSTGLTTVLDAFSGDTFNEQRTRERAVGAGLNARSVGARRGSTSSGVRMRRVRELQQKRRLTGRDRGNLARLEGIDSDKITKKEKRELSALRTKRTSGKRLKKEQLTKRERLELSRITNSGASGSRKATGSASRRASAASRSTGAVPATATAVRPRAARQATAPAAARGAGPNIVNAPINAPITITGASDPEAVRRAVQQGISDAVADAGASTARGVR